MSAQSVEVDQTGHGCSDTDALLSEEEINESEDHYIYETSSQDNTTEGKPHNSQTGLRLSSTWFSSIYSTCKGAAAFKGWVRQEITTQFKLAIPVVLSLFFQYSMLLVSLLFIGHIPNSDSSLVYASAGLAASYVNVTGISVGNGLATAADTLCSQAFGYKNYKRVGVILQRGILILGLFVAPICGLWLNTKSLLLLFHQPPCVASLNAFYVNLYCIVLPFLFLYIVLQHYLQSQSIVWQFVLVGFVANCVNIVLNALLIYAFPLGFKGAVIALVVSNCLPPVLIIFYIWIRKLHKLTWGGWSFESLNEWGQFLKLALPGMIMLCLEWWSAEVTTFIAGAINEDELAANSVWFQTMVILYMPPIGFSIATSIRVGNELGGGNPNGAKKASYLAVVCVLCLAVFYTVLLLTTKGYIGAIFVPGNEVVRRKVSNLMYVACVFLYFDQVQEVCSEGRDVSTIMNFIGYYVIGLPLGITLALKVKWGVLGLWIGMSIGNIVHSLTFVVILLRTDWKKLSEIAMQRAQGSGGEDHTKAAEDDPQKDMEMKQNQTAGIVYSEEDEKLLSTDHASLEDETSFINEATQEVMNDEVKEGMENSSPLPQQTRRQRTRTRVLKLLNRGSLFAIGLAVLVAGGVSSNFHPYVDPGEYENCTVAERMNDTIDPNSPKNATVTESISRGVQSMDTGLHLPPSRPAVSDSMTTAAAVNIETTRTLRHVVLMTRHHSSSFSPTPTSLWKYM